MNFTFRKRLPTGSFFLVLLAWVGLGLSAAWAHKPSDSFLNFSTGGEELEVRWEIAIKDLELLIGLDDNNDRKVTWAELKAKEDKIAFHAFSKLQLEADGREVPLVLKQLLFTEHSDGGYAVLDIETGSLIDADEIKIKYRLLFDIDPTHRGLVSLTNEEVQAIHILDPNHLELTIFPKRFSGDGVFWTFLKEGVWHIWIGLDHILFLLSLLITAVLLQRERDWVPVSDFWPAAKSTLKIVTVFTVAHSITLWLAVMDWVTLPSQFVEATIAFSIIVVAVNNVYPVLPLRGWVIAFIFGLIHGFGFANVLMDLGLSPTAMALSLFAFNVGVELGQLAIVAVFLPVAYLLRGTALYRKAVLYGGSILIALLATVWLIERAFGMEILGI